MDGWIDGWMDGMDHDRIKKCFTLLLAAMLHQQRLRNREHVPGGRQRLGIMAGNRSSRNSVIRKQLRLRQLKG